MKIEWAAFVSLLLAAGASPGQEVEGSGIIQEGIVAHWTLDEPTPGVVADLVDRSATNPGGRSPGTNYGAITGQRGVFGNCLQFRGNGSVGIDDHFSAAGFGPQDMTMSCWVRFDFQSLPYDLTLVSAHHASGYISVLGGLSDGRLGFSVASPGGSMTAIAPTSSGDGQWHHLAGVRQGDTITLFVDGLARASASNPATGPVSAPSRAYIGSNGSANGTAGDDNFFVGWIDDVVLYDRPLDPAEIQHNSLEGQAALAAQTGVTQKGLIAWWSFEETSSGIVSDRVAQGPGYPNGRCPGTNFGGIVGEEGRVGSCYRFGPGRWAVMPDAFSAVGFGPRDLTFMAWIRFTPPFPYATTVFSAHHGAPGYITAIGVDPAGEAGSQISSSSGALIAKLDTPSTDSQWHHLCSVRRGNDMILYWDGLPVKTTTNASVGDVYAFADGYIGANGDGVLPVVSANFFDGWIDELMLYNRALTDAEVQRNFAAQSPELDTTNPELTIHSPANDSVVGTTTVFVDVTVLDESSTTVSSQPPGLSGIVPAGGGSLQGTVPLDVEGENIVTISLLDAAGNAGGSSVAVIRDTTNPEIRSIFPADGQVLGDIHASLVVDVADATSTTVSAGGATISVPAPGGLATFALDLVAGLNSIDVLVTDAAGNQISSTTTLVVDLEAAAIDIPFPTELATFGPGSETVEIQVTVTDLSPTTLTIGALDPVTLPAGGGTWTAAVPLAEGLNAIHVAVEDGFGLISSLVRSVILDTTPPEIEIESPADDATVSGSIDVDARIEDPLPGTGIGQVEFCIDGVTVATLTAPPFGIVFDTRSSSDGTHFLEVLATDGIGLSSCRSRSVFVDNTPPTISLVSPQADSIVSGNLTITIDAGDAGSGLRSFEVTADGENLGTSPSSPLLAPQPSLGLSATLDTIGHPDGPLDIVVNVTDEAGITSSATTRVFVDNTQPSRSILEPANGAIVSGLVQIRASGSDANLESLTILVASTVIATTTGSDIVTTFDTTTRLDGPVSITLIVRDLAGNTSESSIVVEVDNMDVELSPRSLNLKAKNQKGRVNVRLRAANLTLLSPVTSHTFELSIPGGSPITSSAAGLDLSRGQLDLEFERSDLVGSIRAGILNGAIDPDGPVSMALVIDGSIVDSIICFVR